MSVLESEKHDRECRNRRECVRTVVEILALFVASALAYLAWDSLQEIRRQTGAAITAADAAKTSAQTAVDQLKLTTTSLHTTERAWVTVKGAQARPLLGSGKVPTVAMEWRNSGRSPARKTIVRQKVSIKDKLPDGPMPQIDASEDRGIIGPDTSLLVEFEPTNLTEIPIARLKTGQSHLYSFGTTTYLDIFDTEHQTSFCFWLQDIKKPDMSPCGKWNDAN